MVATIFFGGVNILIAPWYAKSVGLSQYGMWESIFMFSGIISIVISLDIYQAVARFFPGEKIEYQKIYASSAIMFVVMINMVFFLFINVFKDWSSYVLMSNYEYKIYIFAISIYIFLFGICSSVRQQLRYADKPYFFIGSSFIFCVTLLLSSYIFLDIYKMGFLGILFSQSLALVFCVLISWYGLKDILTLKFDWIITKKMIKFSYPFVLSSVSLWISLYIDRVIIQKAISFEAMGTYSLMYKVASPVLMFSNGLQGSIVPFIYKNYQNIESKFKLSDIFNKYIAAIFCVWLFISIFSVDFIAIFKDFDLKYANMIPFLCGSMVISGLYMFFPGLNIVGKTDIVMWINILASGVSIILNLIFINNVGVYGAAIATLMSSLVSPGLMFFFGQKYYKMCYNWNFMLLLIVFGIFAIFLCKMVVLWWFKMLIYLIYIGWAMIYIYGVNNTIKRGDF